jgi:prophage maintenance system killer protein
MKAQKEEQKIIIYKTASGLPEIDVKVEKDTVWLNQQQISELFSTDRTVITRHIGNIFKSGELEEKSNVQKMHIANSDRPIKIYNLDVILSVGYRVNTKRATQFRIWATNTLRDYLVRGYAIYPKMLETQMEKLTSLKEAIGFIEKKADTYLLQGKSRELLSLINEFAKTLTLLEEYDNDKIKIKKTFSPKFNLSYNTCKNLIIELKAELKKEGDAGDLFGQEYDKKFEGVINSIYQTFDGKELYNSIEEKAANLLYLAIKDHPFADGNKRIASILFVYFLQENEYLYTADMQRKISNNTLVPLALLVAASDPKEKEMIVKMIMSLLQ